jgi:ribosome-associated toxin RatA of RatAB toxin-antitoxin module
MSPIRASVLLLLVAATAHARPNVSSADMQKLAHHDVLVFSDPWENGLDKAKAIGVIDFAADEVFKVVTDYARWKEYLPRVRDSRVLSASAQGALIDLIAELPWPAGNAQVQARYTHEKLSGGIYRIRFEMVRGTMKQYLGSLYIEPFAPGKSTITYEVLAEPDVIATDSTINSSVKKSAGGFVHALRSHINQLYRAGALFRKAPSPMDAAPFPSSAKLER